MDTAAESMLVPRESQTRSNTVAVKAILVGGSLAGLFDITYAMLRWSWHVPRVVAGGLLGPEALRSESLAVWCLGLILHFSITNLDAAIYYSVSRKLQFLKQHAVLCGIFFGIAMYLVMNLIVVPLSALHTTRDLSLAALREGLLVHMVLGLIIALSIKRFSR
jgi:hypothetical protein